MTGAQDMPGAEAPVPHNVVVVGASHAGVQLADRLRAEGYTGEITLISHESHLPYQRPPLSKAWLKGEASTDSVLLRDPAHYADQKIELITGTRVEQLERVPGGVEVWFSRRGERQTRRFDQLVLATGARARRLTLPGADHPDVLVLRDLDHARSLAARVQAGPIVVIGGGFVGLEVAATARALGAEVTVIEAGERLLARAVGPDTAATLLAAHRAMATEVVLGAAPAEILHGDNGIHAVRLDDGREIPAATVLVGIGAQARTELAEQLGLECDGGVVVDERCRASDGWTLAIGDCTTHVSGAGSRYRLESVDNAVEQANTAAAVLLGRPVPDRAAPWFWSDQGDQKLQITGLIGGHTSMLVRVDPERPRRRVALYFAGAALVAAECLNSPADFVALRSALGRGYRPGPDDLSDTSIPLKKLLAPVRG
ncbi:NAD(P)/FAD-dependent oxidoreductase [Nocardia beijingensis]|uniref:NAD(P)/FAD-dependent oxidoreductase n=1 Tax=Nocardia beijingensis TaxID=95162 RepID=UPI001895DB12|nr:FAD-dependent oxidoreductase [Nocardia beijingensis]MBF6079550.1 FAD-dependent oxidoreductase [Nocardia beijingensis]